MLESLKYDYFKETVVKELKPARRRDIIWKFLGHPVFMLILGFTLTGIVGGLLTRYWQDKSWFGQQQYLNDQHNLEQKKLTEQRAVQQKYDIKDEVVKAVAETTTAAEDILLTFQWDKKDKRRQTELSERIRYWQEGSRKWRITSKILQQQIASRFTRPEAQTSFQQIVEKRNEAGVNIEWLQQTLGLMGSKALEDEEFKKTWNETKELLNELKGNVQNLVKIFTSEIQEDEQGSVQGR